MIDRPGEHVATVFGSMESLSLLSVRARLFPPQPAKIRQDSGCKGGGAHNCGLDGRGPTTRPVRSNLEKFYGNRMPYSTLRHDWRPSVSIGG